MSLVLQGRIPSQLFRAGRRNICITSFLRSLESTGSSKPETPSTVPSLPKDEEIVRHDGTAVATVKSSTESISKAMKSYLERAEAHHKFMKEQEEEFVFGRRHLANMMGKDPETFTQKDVEEAIRYLFPAAVSVASAKPMMKPPHEIYPKAKAAQFDASGRPHHPFFYTARANFFSIVHEAVSKMNALDAVTSTPLDAAPSDLTFAGTIWISKEELESRTLEALSDDLYNNWVNCMDRLASHPRHDREKEFIMSYRKPLSTDTLQKKFPPVRLDPDGRQSVCMEICTKKTALGSVTVMMPGTGQIDINGKGLDYFPLMRAREAFIYPLQLSNWLGTVDVTAKINGSGIMAQAAALRWGLAMGLAALGAEIEPLRLAGLLTKDRRRKERRHRGCEGARAAWTWKKR